MAGIAKQLARKKGNALLAKSCPQGHEDEEQEEQEENGRSTSLYNTLCEFHTAMCRLSCGETKQQEQHLRCSVLRLLAVAPASWLRCKMRGTAARISSAGHV